MNADSNDQPTSDDHMKKVHKQYLNYYNFD